MSFYRRHNRVIQDVGERSRTKQAHKNECDINLILKQYQRTGIITHVQAARPTYEDLPDEIDYQSSMNTLLTAQEAFAGLPAKIRDHFGNDPAQFLAAFYDSKQEDQLREWGLLRPKPVDTPTPPISTPTEPPKSEA